MAAAWAAVRVWLLVLVIIQPSTYISTGSHGFPSVGAGLLGGLLVADAIDDFGDDFGGGDFGDF